MESLATDPAVITNTDKALDPVKANLTLGLPNSVFPNSQQTLAIRTRPLPADKSSPIVIDLTADDPSQTHDPSKKAAKRARQALKASRKAEKRKRKIETRASRRMKLKDEIIALRRENAGLREEVERLTEEILKVGRMKIEAAVLEEQGFLCL